MPPTDYLDGEIYEMVSDNGTIKSIETASSGNGNKNFRELTSGSWEKVKSVSDSGIIKLDVSENMFGTADNTVVYVLNADGKSYKVGRLGDVEEGSEIRVFSIVENEEIASYITVKM
jgi:hypothetical protein